MQHLGGAGGGVCGETPEEQIVTFGTCLQIIQSVFICFGPKK